MTETDASDVKAARELRAGAVPKSQFVPPAGILIGYARCSTEKQDLTAQREILRGLGVAEERVYLDHGLTGTNRSRPGLNSALAALREGDTLSCQSSTGWLALSRTRERSETLSPREAFGCR